MNQQDRRAWELYKAHYSLGPNCGYEFADIHIEMQIAFRIHANRLLLNELAPHLHP